MKIVLFQIAKTSESYIQTGVNEYIQRLKHYCNFELETFELKKFKGDVEQQKSEEGKLLLSQITSADFVVLLDEQGKEFSSIGFSDWLQKKMNTGMQRIVFVIGGAYGFDAQVYDRANEKIALSKMTFSHQMVRLFFTEQLYRAFTILKGEKYHH